MRTFTAMVSYLGRFTPDQTWFEPGPQLPEVSDRFVSLTRYGGPGEELEGVMDSVSWQVRVAGRQRQPTDAQDIADILDRMMLGITVDTIGGFRVAGVSRVGGAPNALLVDDADRTHFICSYNCTTEFHPGQAAYVPPVSGNGGRVYQGHGAFPGAPAVDLTLATASDYYLDLDSGTLYNATGAP
jgi:hypothetical protein